MLATIRDDTWSMLNKQHIIPSSKRWDYSDIPGGRHKIFIEENALENGVCKIASILSRPQCVLKVTTST